MIQLENLNEYTGVRNKMEPTQMDMLTNIITTDYYYLKASELLLFFHMFKAGKFGELYGSVDPLKITSALIEFDAHRRNEIGRLQLQRTVEQRESDEAERLKTAITYDEYLKKKAQ